MPAMQIFLCGFMPATAYAAVLVLALSSAAVSSAKVVGALEGATGRAAWSLWRESLGLFGLVLLPQVRRPKPQFAFKPFQSRTPLLALQ